MRRSLLTILLLSAITVGLSYVFAACKKDQNTRKIKLLSQELPTSFPAPLYRFEDNPLSEEGFELGRKLFYEPRLSADNLHPCSSCHEQVAAFGTFEHDRSHGVWESHTLRNAPVLFNLAWSPAFHWDGEFSSLQNEAIHPLTGPVEMGETLQNIIDKIKDDPDYQQRFAAVFRYPFIRPEFITKALAQFTGSLIAADSKYDRYKKGETTFNYQEENGYAIYKANCATCHPEPLFTDYSFRNIGLPVDNLLNDYGRLRITKNAADSLKFKVPTLRNTYISSNYMHDGRFNTLQQCINHYRNNVQLSVTLDPLLINGISMTNAESTDLVVFLRTLTDSTLMKNPRFSKPN